MLTIRCDGNRESPAGEYRIDKAATAGRLMVAAVLGCLAVVVLSAPCAAMGGRPQEGPGQLSRIDGFGSNPGNLIMYRYTPPGLPAGAPLVVALHGCNQSAKDYADLSGWSHLADRWRFSVIYPEQRRINNGFRCFNWFRPGDTQRRKGEALSIWEMVDRTAADLAVDPRRIYITGLSAGGYMTASMLALYPDVFAGGAVIAGGPAGCADGAMDALGCMKGRVVKTPEQWGNAARAAYRYDGAYPVLSIFHGTEDATVDVRNMTALVDQWTSLHLTDALADGGGVFRAHDHRIYHDTNGAAVVESYHVRGMGHAIPVDPGPGEDQGGAMGAYAEDRDLFSSYYAARFWGLAPIP
jgi:poly(hydroxyalkanoate) depolymerase family esterase